MDVFYPDAKVSDLIYVAASGFIAKKSPITWDCFVGKSKVPPRNDIWKYCQRIGLALYLTQAREMIIPCTILRKVVIWKVSLSFGQLKIDYEHYF